MAKRWTKAQQAAVDESVRRLYDEHGERRTTDTELEAAVARHAHPASVAAIMKALLAWEHPEAHEGETRKQQIEAGGEMIAKATLRDLILEDAVELAIDDKGGVLLKGIPETAAPG